MPTANQYSIYAQVALSAYAAGLVPGSPLNIDRYHDPDVDMATPQARFFDATWAVLQQSAPTINGFSAVLLQRKDEAGNAFGEKVLAIAGTDGWADVITDVVNITQYGTVLGMPQYASLESFYSQLVSSGQLGAAEQVAVSGHSLGGFLAQAFTARHTNVVSAAYTYNAPGFGAPELLLGFLGVADTAGAAAKTTNVHATDGLSMTAGLGVMLGVSQPVRIEADANPFNNHSVVRLGDALAMYDTYARLQPGITMERAGVLFVASGKDDRRQEDALDALRTVFIGSTSNDSNKTPTGNRESFYSNLYQLQNNASFRTLGNQVQLVEAGPAFAAAAQDGTNIALAYRYALLELLPFAVVAQTDALNQTLYGYYTQRLGLYDETTGQGPLTQSWVRDRSVMLASLVHRNQYDISGALAPNPSLSIKAGHYLDVASDTNIIVGLDLSSTREFAFGGDAPDTFFGRGAGDHLYGGAGDDTLNGLGGDDYLEGNSGDDTLMGGAGADTLLGGAGNDTYRFSTGFGRDTVLDSDGLGLITVGATTLTGGKETAAGSGLWLSTDRQYRYSLLAEANGSQTLSIYTPNGGDRILVGNFQSGQLGIDLDGATVTTPPDRDHTIVGDLAAIDTDPVAAGLQTGTDDLGNVLTSATQADPGRADTLYDSAGNDLLQGRDGADNLVASRGGDDRLEGGNGNDYADGGAGDDTVLGGSGNDILIGGNDDDRLYANTELTTAAAISLGRSQSGTTHKGDWLNGGEGDDTLIAGADNDALLGGAGDDLLVGGAGDDVLDGDDDFTAASTAWTITSAANGNNFDSTFSPVYDNNPVTGLVGGDDVLYGGAGNDRLYGLMGDDLLYGEDGNDILAGDDGDDILLGGAGNDSMTGDYGRDVYFNGRTVVQGDDYLDGGEGNDAMAGEGGDDMLFGGNGDDDLQGGSGNDILQGDAGNDTLSGGGGDDIYIFDAGDGRDTLTDQQGSNRLRFGAAIVLDAIALRRVGNDLVLGVNGTSDQVTIKDWGNTAAAPLATIEFADGSSWDAAYVKTQVLSHPIMGTEFGDSLSAWTGETTTTMAGGKGSDSYTVQFATDVVLENPDEGFDAVTSSADYALGANLEYLYLTGSAVRGTGNDLNNVLIGNAVGNTLDGGSGADILMGGEGNDYLEGGAGNDIMDGGGGADTYSLKLGSGQDRIESADYLLDRMVFGAGITTSSVVASHTQEGTLLRYGSAGDNVLIADGAVRDLLFADGSRLDMNDLFAAQGGFMVQGTGDDDLLADTAYWAKSFEGGVGNDVILGGGNATTYNFSRGDGADNIADLGGLDTLSFGPGISVDDVWFDNDFSGNTPSFKVHYSPDDVVAIVDGGHGSIEQFRFADGSMYSFGQLAAEQGFVAPLDPATGRNIQLDFGNFDRGPQFVVGTAGNDTIQASNEGADVYVAGKGNDHIIVFDNDGQDRKKLVFNLGDGVDTLDITTYSHVSLVFGSGIAPDALRFNDSGGHTTIDYGNQGDRLVLNGRVEGFEFADGSRYSYSRMRSLGAWYTPGGTGGPSAGDPSVYRFNLGDGVVNISGSSVVVGGRPSSGGSNIARVQFGVGIDAAMLTLGKGSLLIRVGDNGDALHLTNFNPDDVYAPNPMQEFLFADGTRLSYGALLDRGFDLQGSARDDVVTGTSTVDRINGFEGNDILSGGAGDDVLDGGLGNDSYRFGPGDGIDRIYDHDPNANVDTVRFSASVTPADVEVRRNGEDLELHLAGSSDSLIVANWYSGVDYRIEQVQFADGTLWDVAALQALAPPPPVVIVGTEGGDVLAIGNHAPIVAKAIDNQRAVEGEPWRWVVPPGTFSDPDAGDSLSYESLLADGNHLPDWLEFDPRTQTFSGTPPDSAAGVVPILLRVSDAAGVIATAGFMLDIANTVIGTAGADTLVGTQGRNVMVGFTGNDTYCVDNADDVVIETSALATEIDTVQASVTWTLSENVENLTLTGAAAIDGAGNTLDNRLTGNAGNNSLTGDAAGETGAPERVNSLVVVARGTALDGGWPSMEVWMEGLKLQTFNVSSVDYAAYTVDVAPGSSARGVDVVFTNDAYAPARGQDRNLYVSQIVVNGRTISGSGPAAILDYGTHTAGLDWVNTTVGAGLLATNGALHFGLNGNDLLDGGAGADTLTGGYGNDLYMVDNTGDRVLELAAAGHDTVRSSVSYALSDYVEDLELTGSSSVGGTGNAGRNTLRGNSGANRLDGGAGADLLVGGAGDDTYVVDDTGDAVYEVADAGADTVETSVSFTLGAEVENLVLIGTSAVNGTGNALDNTLIGNSADNLLTGGAGNDTLRAGAGNDKLYGGDGNDALIGDAPDEAGNPELVNSLVVVARGTALDGGWPSMEVWMEGLKLQTFNVSSVDYAAYTVDVAPGSSARGVDVVFTNDAYAPARGQDRNLYVSQIVVNGRTISGSGPAAILDYGTHTAGLDWVNTTVGAGLLATNGALHFGLNGNDLLDGGAGADTLTGGYGNDLYMVDNTGDRVLELAAAGHDTVRSSVSYALSDYVEDLELTGSSSVGGTGNAGRNTLRGNSGANRLDGGAGADLLVGGAGDDTYVVDDTGDAVYEVADAGTDTVQSSVSFVLPADVENLVLTGTASTDGMGNAIDNTLEGNSAGNTLSGGLGDDTLRAGGGNDRLYGGDGNDVLVGDAPGETGGPELVNTLVVYARGTICEGGWPTMEVWLGGVKVQSFNVTSPALAAYTITAPLGLQASSVDLAFTNDAWRPDLGQDRNLFVDRIEVNRRTLSATDTGVMFDSGSGAAAFDGLKTSVSTGVLASHGALRIGLSGNDLLDGGAGIDVLVGGAGNDTFVLGRGYGNDTIAENDTTPGNTDVAFFQPGIAADQLWFRQVSNDLELGIIGTADKFSLANWYSGGQYHVEQFKTSDGRTLLDSQVQNLVSAMAAFAPPAMGQTSLSTAYAAQLAPVIAANWQ